MKRPQASQNAPANPTPKLPLHGITARRDPHLRPRIRRRQLLLHALRKARVQRTPARENDVREHGGADIDVDLRQGRLDQCDDGLGGRGRRICSVGEGEFGIEDGFDGAVAVDGGEHLVPAVWHLEGSPRVLARHVHVRAALR